MKIIGLIGGMSWESSDCTEIELLIKPSDIKVMLFETTRLHAEKAVRLALTV